MFFTSYEFLGFLLVLFVCYYTVPKKFQWMLLLLFSYVFYFLANPYYLIYISVTTISVYYLGLKIEKQAEKQKAYLAAHRETLTKGERKAYKERVRKRQTGLFLAALILNLGILAVLKYTNFVIANVNGILHAFGSGQTLAFVDLLLPMGISFYTFQAVGYLIDVYRGTISAEKNLFRFALFVSFFPQLVQGPISRFNDLSQTLYEEHKFAWNGFCRGLQRILWGYFKKLVVADRMLIGVNEIIRNPNDYTGAYVFAGMMFYALELYADFTGGIDITIGTAQCLGIRVTENFNRPYFSKSIKEYWRRWHITMGTWFTDYIFYPISISGPMLKISKVSRKYLGNRIGKRVPVYLSSFAVWFATGIWHGASWNFIVWGLGNWAVIMISQELEPLYRKFHEHVHVEGRLGFRIFRIVRTVLLMSCLRTFDCYRDVPLTFRMLGTMFTAGNWNILWDGSLLGLGLQLTDYVVLLMGTLLIFAVSMLQRNGSVREKIGAKPYPVRFAIWYGLFLIVLLTGVYGIGYDASQFIYNQF